MPAYPVRAIAAQGCQVCRLNLQGRPCSMDPQPMPPGEIKEQALIRGAIEDDRQAREVLQKGGCARLIEPLAALAGEKRICPGTSNHHSDDAAPSPDGPGRLRQPDGTRQ